MKALVATMGKLAEIIYHCLKTGEPYEYQGEYKVIVAPQPTKNAELSAVPRNKLDKELIVPNDNNRLQTE